MADNGLMNGGPNTIDDLLKNLCDLPEYTHLQHCRDQQDAAGMIEAAVALVLANEDRPVCELVRGNVYRELGMTDRALASYRQVLEMCVRSSRWSALPSQGKETCPPEKQ
jgi:hypothetical protein